MAREDALPPRTGNRTLEELPSDKLFVKYRFKAYTSSQAAINK